MSVGSNNYVAHLAHLGGAFFGFVFIMLDRRYNFNIDRMFNSFKDLFSSSGSSGTTRFRKPRKSYRAKNVEDAEFYEINESKKNEDEVTEEVIDQILEKISRSGYQNLTEREKRILFEASKKG
jgi:hypothetical protein